MHKREKGNHIFDRLLEINSVNGNRKNGSWRNGSYSSFQNLLEKNPKQTTSQYYVIKKCMREMAFASLVIFLSSNHFFVVKMSQVEFQAREPNTEKKLYAAYCVVQTAKSEIKKTCPRNGILFVSLSTAQNYSRSFHHLKHVLIIKFLPQRKIIVCGISLFV